MELQCKVQHYEWGKIGEESTVAKLVASADPNTSIEKEKPYAELWIGTHPNGPALIIERGVLLSDYLKDNLDAIGPDVQKRFGVAVPFLLKVLSVRKALSIQAHPNKAHAEQLHSSFPDLYKDPNHKPELAIALTPFEALCGFRDIQEIQQHLKYLPELSEILNKEHVTALLNVNSQDEAAKDILKNVFESLMTSDRVAVSDGLLSLISRLETEDESTQEMLLLPLMRRLHSDYPGDVGCFAPFFINYLTLSPGDAVYLGPNLPHAYLSGDCIECMACSDNVVRAGLTPKLIDVPTLVQMLDYRSYNAQDLLFRPTLHDPYSCIWSPPVEDFAVIKVTVPGGESYNTSIRASPSLIIITSGSGSVCDTEPVRVRAGTALFLKASRQLTITADQDIPIEAYQAVCNL